MGLHWSRIDLRAQGSVSLGAGDATAESEAKGNVPLPLLGLRYERYFSEQWSGGLAAGVFAVNYGDDDSRLKGRLWSTRVHAEYRFTAHLAAGAALEGFSLRLDAGAGEWDGTVKYGYWGPQLYLRARY